MKQSTLYTELVIKKEQLATPNANTFRIARFYAASARNVSALAYSLLPVQGRFNRCIANRRYGLKPTSPRAFRIDLYVKDESQTIGTRDFA